MSSTPSCFRPTRTHTAVRDALIVIALGGLAVLPSLVLGQTVSAPAVALETVTVVGETPISTPSPAPYAGGWIARGGQTGMLGNLDNMTSPFVVNSYTSKLIEAQQARTLGDVLKNDPSVQVTRGYGNSAETFNVRGLKLTNDDLAFNGLFGILPRQVLPIEMVERVEVFKGASAFLSGASPTGSGLGGLINIQPKRGTDVPLTRLNVDYSNSSRVGGGVDIGRRWGPDNAFGIRVNAAHRDGEGAIRDEDRRVTVGTVGLDFSGERLRVSVDAGYQKVRDDHPRQGILVTGGVPDLPSIRKNYGHPLGYSELESTYGVLRAEYDVSDNWMTYGAIGTSSDREKGEYYTPRVTSPDGAGTIGRLGVPFRRDTVTGEVGLRGRLQTGPVSHRVNASFSALKLTKRSAYTFAASVPHNINGSDNSTTYLPTILSAGDLDNPDITGRTTLHSVALSDTLGFVDDRLLVTVGARHQYLRDEAYAYDQTRTANYDDSATTPMAGVVFRATDEISVYANHIEGLAPGAAAPLTAVNRGALLKPERAKQYEAGVKFDYGTFGGNVSVFQIQKPQAYLDPASNVFSAAGRQRNRGVELSAYGEPVDGVRVLGGLTLLQPKLRNTPNGETDGNRAVGVPNYQATLGAEYDIAAVPGLSVQAFVLRKGTQYIDIENTMKLKPSTRLDLGARYATKVSGHNVVWRAGVNNVTNRNYWDSVSEFSQVTQSTPRTYRLSMSVDF